MLLSDDSMHWLQVAAAVATLLSLIRQYRGFLGDFWQFATRYPGLSAILIILYLMVFGRLGTGLGIHYLFWHDDFFPRLVSSMGATLVLGVVGVIAYYLDPFPWATDRKTAQFLHADEVIKHRLTAWWSRRIPRLGARAPVLPPGPGPEPRPADYVKFAFNALIDPVAITPFQSWLDPVPANSRRIQRFLRAARGPFLAILMAPAALPMLFPSVPRTAPTGHIGWEPPPVLDVARDPGGYLLGLSAWLLGIIAGVLLIKGFIRLSTAFRGGRAIAEGAEAGPVALPPGSPDWVEPDRLCPVATAPGRCAGGGCPRGVPAPGLDPPPGCRARRQLRGSVIVFALVFVWAYVAMGLIRHYRAAGLLPDIPVLNFTPAFAICAALALLAMAYATIAYMRRSLQVPVLIGLIAWIGLANGDPYKLRFEHMAYDRPVDLRRQVARAYFPDGLMAADPTDLDAGPELVDDLLAREAWKALAAPGDPDVVGGRPKLVLVAVSGGATRSAYWTAVMLDRLERDLCGFGRRVRIISGASGGMLGTACYVTYRRDVARSTASERPCGMVHRGQGPSTYSPWVGDVPFDSMDPLARYIALSEVWKALWPGVTRVDRGVILERDWSGIRYPFADLAPLERAGRVPSLIFSPMIVEDGRRLLISNLDLSHDDSGRPSPILLTRGRQIAHDEAADADGSSDELYSLSGLEYSRLFPRDRDGGLLLSTAVRMNASFPFLSPAVNLPTVPPRRVVDAAYYDNYGIQVATAWIHQNRDWLTRHTSGVLLVQIRDASSVKDRLDIGDDRPGAWDRLTRGFQFFTSPIDGAIRARSATASFRNDADVQSLTASAVSSMQGKVADPESFFSTVIFENSAEVSLTPGDFWDDLTGIDRGQIADSSFREVAMSWYLTRAEQAATRRAIPDDPPPGSIWSRPEERQRIHAKLTRRVFAPDRAGPGRDFHLKRLEQLRNYERLANLARWWRGAGKPRPPRIKVEMSR